MGKQENTCDLNIMSQKITKKTPKNNKYAKVNPETEES